MAKKRAPKSPPAADVSSSDSDASQEDVDFEESLHEVEQIVARLESGELGLTESLDQYETGVRELKRCHALLEAAEQKVCLLSGFDADGNPITEPLNDGSGDASVVKTGASPPVKKRVRVRKKVARPRRPSDEDGGSLGEPTQGKQRPDSVDDSPGLF